MKRVAGYGRVSTVEQAEKGTSLEDQRKRVEEFCKKEGYQFTGFYDDQMSGASRDRPALKRLLIDAQDKQFDTVAFTKLDRLGRSIPDIRDLYNEISNGLGIDLVCISDPSLNTTTPTGKLMVNMLGSFAEFERDLISERTSGGRRIRWRQGKAIVGELPFGYRQGETPGKIEIDSERAEVYQKIVSLYLDKRLSFRHIADQLTREGVETPTMAKGKKVKRERWSSITIGKMLKRPAYKGESIYNKYKLEWRKGGANGQYMVATGETKPEDQWVTVKYPPLITELRWRQVQQRIENQKIKPKRVYKEYEDNFMLDGFIRCGECGGRMNKRVKVEKGGRVRKHYVCYWHRVGPKTLSMEGREQCKLKSIDADTVDDRIFAQVMHVFSRPKKYVEAWLKDFDTEDLERDIARLEEKEKELKRQLKEGFQYLRRLTDPSTKTLYEEEQQKTEDDLQVVRSELDKKRRDVDFARNKVSRFSEFEEEVTPWLKAMTKVKNYLWTLPFHEKKRIVEAVVSPETGGTCKVRYVRPSDFLDYSELQGMTEEELDRPLEDQELCITGDFNVNIEKLEGIIRDLSREEFFRIPRSTVSTPAPVLPKGGSPLSLPPRFHL